MLFQLSCFFLLFPPPPSTPHSLRQSPPLLFMSMGHMYSSLSTPFPYTALDIPENEEV